MKSNEREMKNKNKQTEDYCSFSNSQSLLQDFPPWLGGFSGSSREEHR